MKINVKTHLVVDMTSGMEVTDAVEVDEYLTTVTIRRPTYTGDTFVDVVFPIGVKVVRRR